MSKEPDDDLVYREDICETVKDLNEPDISVYKLRKGLQRFNEDLGVYINDDQRYKLGRVLTIVDASISDPEQRKAIKDLVNSEWWSMAARNCSNRMNSPHSDIRGLCLALGFELYPSPECVTTILDDNEERYAQQNYEKVIKE